MYTRFNGTVVPFGAEATVNNRTVFGSLTQSDDINDNLNPSLKKGWEIVGVNDNPTLQDFNAMGFTLGALTSYLYQQGVAEWSATQEYFIGSLCSLDGIYKSLSGTAGAPNTNNNPATDVINWVKIVEKSEVQSLLDEKADLVGNPTQTFEVAPAITNTQAINKAQVQSLIPFNGTWVDVTATRTHSVTYTNTNLTPRLVNILQQGNSSAGAQRILVSIDGATAFMFASDSDVGSTPFAVGNFVVPAGSTYRITLQPVFVGTTWHELN